MPNLIIYAQTTKTTDEYWDPTLYELATQFLDFTDLQADLRTGSVDLGTRSFYFDETLTDFKFLNSTATLIGRDNVAEFFGLAGDSQAVVYGGAGRDHFALDDFSANFMRDGYQELYIADYSPEDTVSLGYASGYENAGWEVVYEVQNNITRTYDADTNLSSFAIKHRVDDTHATLKLNGDYVVDYVAYQWTRPTIVFKLASGAVTKEAVTPPSTSEPITAASGQTINGTSGDDLLEGSAGSDTISGLAGDDRIIGNGGDDVIRGGDGFDNVEFSDVFANYTISAVSGGKVQSEQSFTISHTGGDGTDTVYMDVEFFDFADRKSVARSVLLGDSEADDGQQIRGTEGNDNNVTGTSGNDDIATLGGDDAIVYSAGNDKIDGGAGLDTLIMASYTRSEIELSKQNGTITLRADGGSDTLLGVERVQLKDTWLALDFDGAAGAAAKIIVAAFGEELLPAYLGVGISLADQGLSQGDLAALVVDGNLMNDGGTNVGFVNTVFENLLGRSANILEEQLYTGYLDQGLYSKADLLNLAANTTAANASMVEYAIDYVGLPYDAGLV